MLTAQYALYGEGKIEEDEETRRELAFQTSDLTNTDDGCFLLWLVEDTHMKLKKLLYRNKVLDRLIGNKY